MKTFTDEHAAERAAYIAALPIVYTVQFMPQSLSRYPRRANRTGKQGDGAGPYYFNAGGYDGKGAACINWRIGLARASGAGPHLLTDYSQGAGHLPESIARRYGLSRSVDGAAAEARACETGHCTEYFSEIGKLPAPELEEVLACLILDSSVLDCRTFEEYAADYGLDPDSRAGEASYNAARAQSLTLAAILSPTALDDLRRLYSEF